MSEEKVKLPEKVSPIGMAKYAWLNKADTKFAKDGKGDFKVRVLIEDTEANRAWCAAVEAEGKAFAKAQGIKLKKTAKVPFIFPEDVDEDDFIPDPDTGKAAYDEDHRGKIWFETKSKFKPGLIDSKKQELPEDVLVMSGDKVRIKFALNPYEGLGSGINFRLKVAQLIEKNTTFSGERRVDTSGFDEVEDGYTANRSARDNDDEDGDEQF